ncbi:MULTISPECIES: rhodanese-like domain-containing protein [Photobacterium]|uniref:Rhodanese domain-containing protein n=1 Tax=Photobacterium ganghwense TaxID=320778 RepID=A0A0J1K9Z6_9GAMM|nr:MULTISPECIES: rhodanese-like domain-containing protein [Photobacterium]KLV11162.1 hypothetical protein ABT57_02680 [Photobacterium ganghwense]MBV1839953.1 rhodanese-like domain-containing protein [Photobacterium ganghwense]PSU05212.1 rhodanese-like domain-containing protein [Photobacterium ganghwense]QSV13835.1 rhodanese-like domain-containing protein [Photobacterium ganghwense]
MKQRIPGALIALVCWSGLTLPVAAEVVSPAEFWQTYQAQPSNPPLIVDVRTPAEFADGHLPGAINIPFDDIKQLTSLEPDTSRPIMLYCQSGRRSGIAEAELAKLGYTQLYNGENYQALDAAMPMR